MMESMWNLDLDMIKTATIPPAQILESQCNYLEQITKGRVLAKVSRYKKPLLYGNKVMQEIFNEPDDKLGDLGNTPEIHLTYEFFLTSPTTPNYKFRIMIFSYVTGQYPVEILLSEDIAIDIGENMRFSCSTEERFNVILSRIVNSTKVRQVIKALNEMAKQEDGEVLT